MFGRKLNITFNCQNLKIYNKLPSNMKLLNKNQFEIATKNHFIIKFLYIYMVGLIGSNTDLNQSA